MRWPIILFMTCFLLIGFAVFAATRPQICNGTWNRAHTVLTLGGCEVEW